MSSAAIPERSEAFQGWLEAMLAPVPVPPSTTSRDLVRRAIRFEHPPRIPYSLRPPWGTDFFELAELERLLAADPAMQRLPGDEYVDEWGVTYRKTRFSWDEVVRHPLRDLARIPYFDRGGPERMARLAPFVRLAQQAGKYVVAADPVLLHERVLALAGFEQAMTAPYLQKDGLEALLDQLTELTVAAVAQAAGIGGVDAFMTWQDIALQDGPWMRPELFRDVYKPRYARIVEAVHGAGMDCIWHTCGQVTSLIPDLIEIGVDVLQLDQQRLVGHGTIAGQFGARICFWNTVDIQWAASPEATASGIDAEVAAMLGPFAGSAGGMMARHYGDPASLDLSDEFHEASTRAFLRHGCTAGGHP